MTFANLIQQLINQNILKTPRIIEAFKAIDRKDFAQPYNLDEAYGNYPLSIGRGQTISQPLTVAFMLELLEPKTGEKILDVGSGSGWQTVLLAYIVSRDNSGNEQKVENKNSNRGTYAEQSRTYAETIGKVYAVERIQELCDFGKANVAKYSYIQKKLVEFFCQDGSKGLAKKAPFDKIIVAAAAEKVPEALKEQLKVGGRLVLPARLPTPDAAGYGGQVGKYDQAIVKIDKVSKNKYREEIYPGFVFVPLIEDKC